MKKNCENSQKFRPKFSTENQNFHENLITFLLLLDRQDTRKRSVEPYFHLRKAIIYSKIDANRPWSNLLHVFCKSSYKKNRLGAQKSLMKMTRFSWIFIISANNTQGIHQKTRIFNQFSRARGEPRLAHLVITKKTGLVLKKA